MIPNKDPENSLKISPCDFIHCNILTDSVYGCPELLHVSGATIYMMWDQTVSDGGGVVCEMCIHLDG
jgi:hypothetical protein